MTVIQVRGTSGSGKSTVMRKVIEAICPLDQWEHQYVVGRKQPESYRHNNIYVLGHYGTQCGGGDTIGSARKIYELIQRIGLEGKIILCEGLLLSEDCKWSSQLPDLRVVFLTTPTETCLQRIGQRRKDAGNEKPLNIDNTVKRVPVIERARRKLIDLGVCCRRASVGQAVGIVLDWVSNAST